jgi:hypothetical protein
MTTQFGLPSMAERCVTRFPGLPGKRRRAEAPAPLTEAVCSNEPAAATAK